MDAEESKMPVNQFQDLGDLSQKIRLITETGPSGVETLMPNDGVGHGEAMSDFRQVLESHYGNQLSELAGDDEQVIVQRIVLKSDEMPHIEYQLVDERE